MRLKYLDQRWSVDLDMTKIVPPTERDIGTSGDAKSASGSIPASKASERLPWSRSNNSASTRSTA